MGRGVRALVAGVFGAGALMMWAPASLPVQALNSVVTVDSNGNVGRSPSLVLDAAGSPVVSYHDVTNGELKVAHCNDASCAGGDESLVTLDSTGVVISLAGRYTSLVLDAAGNPVIGYTDFTHLDLKVAHCNDANCAGGDESLVTVDSTGNVGQHLSLVLDAAGNPVISYNDATNADLKVVHCNDANCAGGDESVVTVDSSTGVGAYTSLVLDAAGNPVISHYDFVNDDLKVAHCNDANCAGDNESLITVDSNGNVGQSTSLALDAAGNPLVTYYDGTNNDLKVVHCNDANCAGSNESLVAVDSTGNVGGYSSLVLDAAGNPMVSYYDATNGDLKVVHCYDVDCAGGNESLVAVDSTGNVGRDTSLVLDPGGNPVISYYDVTNADLKVAQCGLANCVDLTPPVTSIGLSPAAPDGVNGWYVSPVSVTVGAVDDDEVHAARCVIDPAVAPALFDDLPDTPCAASTVSTAGRHVVYAAAVDLSGNRGPVVTRSFRIMVDAAAGAGAGWSGTGGSVKGDFDGDGAADLAVGVPAEDLGALADAGRVQVLYGGPTGLSAAGDQLWTQDSAGIADAAEGGDRFGAALAVGDLNSDGRSDLVIGAPGEDVAGAVDAGAVHVLYGSASGLRTTGSQRWTQDSAGIADAAEGGDWFGAALAIGSLGKGTGGDLLIGAPGENLAGADNVGMVHAIYGGGSGLRAAGSQVWTQDSPGVADRAETGDRFGAALATGDLAGTDHLDDAVIGAPDESLAGISRAGLVHLLRATRTGLSATGSRLVSQDTPGVADRAETGDRFGAVLAAGDLGHGAHADLVVGVPDEDLAAVHDAGVAHVLYGGDAGLQTAGAQLWTQNSAGVADTAEAGDRFGAALAVGDLGRGAREELVVGVPGEDVTAHRDAGIVHVLYANATGLATAGSQVWSQDTPGVAETGESGDRFGAGLAIADFNDGGAGDLAVGVPGEDLATNPDTGLLHIIYAATTGLTTAGNRIFHQDTPGILGTNEPGNNFAATFGH